MAKHIHIWVEAGRQLGKTQDAGPAHAPAGSSKGGQFVSGSGGGGSSSGKAKGKPLNLNKPGERNLAHGLLKQENSAKKEAPAVREPRGNSSDPKEREAYKKMQREKQAANFKTKSPEEQAFLAKLAAKKSTSAPAAKMLKQEKSKAFKALEDHPLYHKEDFNYLKDKGYGPEEIKALWDRDQKQGHGPTTVNKNGPAMQAHFKGVGQAMGIIKK